MRRKTRMRKGGKPCIYICIPRGRVGEVCAYVYAFRAERVKVMSITAVCGFYNWGEPERAPHLSYCWAKSSLSIESVDSINRDERGFPLTQYITNGRISRARNTTMHFKHHHRVLCTADFQSNECITSP